MARGVQPTEGGGRRSLSADSARAEGLSPIGIAKLGLVRNIGYFGPQGTFTEQAALALAEELDELIALPTVGAALD
ncbi:MAG: hypothetical protein ACRDRL_33890, partial [Sciscionella sp.]